MRPPSDTNAVPELSAKPVSLGRRFTGIGALFSCALLVDPARQTSVVSSFSDLTQSALLHGLIIPALAAVGLWLVLPKPLIIGLCAFMLAIAHAQLGSADWFAGYLYPAIAVVAALALLRIALAEPVVSRPPNAPESSIAPDRDSES